MDTIEKIADLKEAAGLIAVLSPTAPPELRQHRKDLASRLTALAAALDASKPVADEKDAALKRAADFLAELYAKYQRKIGPFATQAQKIQTACRAALFVPPLPADAATGGEFERALFRLLATPREIGATGHYFHGVPNSDFDKRYAEVLALYAAKGGKS